jgi:hypothetical protein
MRWTDILATEKAKGRKINWSAVRVVSQKGALVELSEVAVKSEDAKNNESRNEAKGGLCRATFRKGKSRSEGEDEDEGEGVQQQDGGRREVGEVGRMWTGRAKKRQEFTPSGNWPPKAGLAAISYFLTLQITSQTLTTLTTFNGAAELQNCDAVTKICRCREEKASASKCEA